MTDKQLIDFIIEKKRSPSSLNDYLNLLVLPIPPLFSAIGISMINAYYKFGANLLLPIGGTIIIILSFLFAYLTIVRLIQNRTFVVIDNGKKLNINEIAKLVTENFNLNEIKIDQRYKRIRAETEMTAFSWGEKITIVLNESEILINSRPASSSQPFTITKDQTNIKKLRVLLQG